MKESTPARIASPYWSEGTLDALGFGRGSLVDKLEVLCDLRFGDCDASIVWDMLDRGAQVVSVDGLHAKVYLGKGGAIIGSANATARGLWHSARAEAGNHEGALWDRRSEAVLPWLDWWNEMEEKGIDLANRRLAELLLDIAAQNKPPLPEKKPVSLLEVLRAGTYEPGKTPLHVAIDWIHADEAVVEEAGQLSDSLHETIGVWQR